VNPVRKVLELLITVRQARSHGVTLSHVDATRDQLFTGWMATFQGLAALTPSKLEELSCDEFDSLRSTACFLTRVFHFVMGIEGVWAGKLPQIAPDLALVLVHFAVVSRLCFIGIGFGRCRLGRSLEVIWCTIKSPLP
jgi:hypothetical protein